MKTGFEGMDVEIKIVNMKELMDKKKVKNNLVPITKKVAEKLDKIFTKESVVESDKYKVQCTNSNCNFQYLSNDPTANGGHKQCQVCNKPNKILKIK